MNVLIMGLGSMGKRRVRCLKSLGIQNIVGFDLREDRRSEVKEKYNVRVVGGLDSQVLDSADAMIISTPPDKHNQCLRTALGHGKPAFVEASVILDGLAALDELARKQKVLIAPSCTLRFHPAIRDIKGIVKGGQYGRVTNFTYHSGQYLPDWHPWEAVKDFYVGQKETGGCREIIPFELTWLVDVVGFPRSVKGLFGKTMDVGADIDDTYVVAMDFGGSYGSMTIDVVSRYATRSLVLNMERGQVLWRWDEAVVNLYDAASQSWIHYTYPQGLSAEGYNRNITENMYIDEIRSFLDAVAGRGTFPNSLEEDIKVLQLLHQIEGK
ncbi:MAG: Gfo/Idh/MocA family oxidoreductase [Chloroflexi bacterium]|nr:Gfo/Idh/MocA family oxidoreductase [Chloroflexota bacterium]